MNKEPRQTDTPLAAALATDVRIVLGKLLRRLREQAHAAEFTHAQKLVLLHLDRDGPTTVSALARAEGVRPQSMRITVAALEAAGAVHGAPHPTDGRQTLIDLTPIARERIKANRAAKEDWLFRALQAQLSAQEQTELAAALKLFQRLTEF